MKPPKPKQWADQEVRRLVRLARQGVGASRIATVRSTVLTSRKALRLDRDGGRMRLITRERRGPASENYSCSDSRAGAIRVGDWLLQRASRAFCEMPAKHFTRRVLPVLRLGEQLHFLSG
jgi:hypothetical protein